MAEVASLTVHEISTEHATRGKETVRKEDAWWVRTADEGRAESWIWSWNYICSTQKRRWFDISNYRLF